MGSLGGDESSGRGYVCRGRGLVGAFCFSFSFYYTRKLGIVRGCEVVGCQRGFSCDFFYAGSLEGGGKEEVEPSRRSILL